VFQFGQDPWPKEDYELERAGHNCMADSPLRLGGVGGSADLVPRNHPAHGTTSGRLFECPADLSGFPSQCGALVAIWDQPAQVIRLPWLQVGDLMLELPLQVSSVTLGACAVVTGLNLVAQIYGFGYMEMDWGWARFFSLLGLFEGGCVPWLCATPSFSAT
jgi:NADH:ubiquinone oxidoreductase subunit 5 (chain L)/Multisubunit Na+/H+ antiporter, MnhA subunit